MEDRAEGRLGNARRTGSGDPPCTIPLLHDLFLILFIQTVFTFAAPFFYPHEKDVCGFAPVRDSFRDRFFFFGSNLHDLQP